MRKYTYKKIKSRSSLKIEANIPYEFISLVVEQDDSRDWCIYIVNQIRGECLARILPSQYKKLERVIGKIRGKK